MYKKSLKKAFFFVFFWYTIIVEFSLFKRLVFMYNFKQKFTSLFLLVFFIFSFVVEIPFRQFISTAHALENDFSKIVSILVEEEIYDDVEDVLERYWEDIQQVLPDTKVLITPISSDKTVFDIASFNERLYFEGLDDRSIYDSSLVWTLLVWNLPVPIVFDWKESNKSIFPYVDFEKKAFIYNKLNKRYEKSSESFVDLKAEIWHWVVSPNSWDREKDVDLIMDYFDKNHSFYNKTWKFSQENFDAVDPKVFYYDLKMQNDALNPYSFRAYEAYRRYREDLAFNRYNKDIAEEMQWFISEEYEKNVWELVDSFVWDLNVPSNFWAPDLSNAPDYSVRYLMSSLSKKFPEIFNPAKLWEIKKNVYNSWRYSSDDKDVNFDNPIFFVWFLDEISDAILKEATIGLEDDIDNIIKTWVSRKIALPTTFQEPWRTYVNFLNWTKAQDITQANQCSFYRWSLEDSGRLVQANRAFNFKNNANIDSEFLKSVDESCIADKSYSYFWWNTPLNIDFENIEWTDYVLNYSNPRNSFVPVFDLAWSMPSLDESKIPSPVSCYENNLLMTFENNRYWDWNDFRVPDNMNFWSSMNWSCNDFPVRKNFSKTFEEAFAEWLSQWNSCYSSSIRLDWTEVSSNASSCEDWETTFYWNYSFKSIDSLIEHKSPTLEELQANIESLSSQALPVDRVRYASFIWANWEYKKFNYPNFFDITLSWDFSFEDIILKVDETLLEKTSEFNEIIESSKPNFSWKRQEAFELLKTWDFPENVDLLDIFKNKESWELEIWDGAKEIFPKDLVYFAVYWNSLESIASKFKFIFENYLWDEFEKETSYPLPRSSKLYEIVYLNAKWNSRWMLIEINPEEINYSPYSDVIAENQSADGVLAVNRVSYESPLEEESWDFACAPPDWVPVWEWFPAVICWLWDVLDFSISIWWPASSSDEDIEAYEEYISENSCERDLDNNWLSDCIDKNDNLVLSWWKYFSKLSPFEINIDLLSSWEYNLSDSLSLFNAEIIEVLDSSWDIISSDKYDDYVKLLTETWKFSAWRWILSFVSQDEVSSVKIKARAYAVDKNGNEAYSIESEEYSFDIRDWKISFYTKVLETSNDDTLLRRGNEVIASGATNLFIYSDEEDFSQRLSYLNSLSTSKNKMFISFSWKSDEDDFEVKYPINLKLLDSSWNILEEKDVSKQEILDVYSFAWVTKSWEYSLVLEDSLGFSAETDIVVLASNPVRIQNNLSTNILETKWVVSNNAIILYDEFDNIANNWFYDVLVSLEWKWLEFASWRTSKVVNFYDWSEFYEIVTTWFPWKNEIKLSLVSDENVYLSSNVYTVSDINFGVIFSDSLKVWWNDYDFDIKIRNIDNYFWEAFVEIDWVYLDMTKNISLKDSSWKWTLKTKTQAWKSVPIKIYLAWARESKIIDVDILPERPVKVDISSSSANIEANWEDTLRVYASLFDAFWNKAFNANVEAEIETKFKNSSILELVSPSLVYFENWDASFEFKSTKTPWIWHFKVKANIDETPFEYISSWEERVIDIVREDAWRAISSYYFRNYDDEEFSYNGLYTTLLWWAYWDITKQNYLAWEFIFDKNNASISSTSLIYDPISRESIVDFSDKWWISIADNSDVSQDISVVLTKNTTTKVPKVLFVNNIFNSVVSSLEYRLSNPWSFVCGEESNLFSDYFENCLENLEENYNDYDESDGDYNENRDYIVFDKLYNNEDLKIVDTPEKVTISFKESESFPEVVLFNLDKTKRWEFNLRAWYNLELDLINSWKYSTFIIKNKEWEPIVRFSYVLNKNIRVVDEWVNYFWWAIARIESNLYWAKLNYSNSDASSYGISIWYDDPFVDSYDITSLWSSSSKSYENASNSSDLWWWNDNKTLLSFASWESVWEATMGNQSIGLINIWDPVLSLKDRKKESNKKIKEDENRDFDSTIWKLVADETNLYKYRIFDYNWDWKDDVLTLDYDMFLRLYENHNWDFINRQELAKIYDTSKASLLLTWDFSWDSYDDIFLTNWDWEMFILNNNFKDFVRFDIDDEYFKDKLVSQAEVFDMDNDGKDDIVVLDDSWSINILYWLVDWDWNLDFTRKFIWEWHLVNITEDIIDFWWAIYFDWLIQPSNSLKKVSSYDYEEWSINNQIKDTVQKALSTPEDSQSSIADNIVNKRALINLIFNKFQYFPERYSPEESNDETSQQENMENKENVLNSLWDLPWAKIQDKLLLKSFLNNAEKKDRWDITYSWWEEVEEKMFIKSEFASSVWVDVEKTFRDINWWSLKSQDEVEVTIKIKNNSNNTINNFSYVENIDEAFYKHSDFAVYVNWSSAFYYDAPEPIYDYDFMIDSYSISVWDSMEIRYIVKMSDYTYGDLEVWYFEDWTWVDPYWDIKLKDENFSCAWYDWLYLSTSSREYIASLLPLQCSASEDNSSDILDKADELKNNPDKSLDYANDNLWDIVKDLDWDWKPDYENNISEISSSNSSLLWNINSFRENTDKSFSAANDFVKGLGCWFGSWWSIPLPINSAPLAPWNASSVLWIPTTPPLVYSWIPIFAIPTVWLPPMWPPSAVWAWGFLSPIPWSTFRIFVTPTLTWALWTALCFGDTVSPNVAFPMGINPLFQVWWNCVVIASPLWGKEPEEPEIPLVSSESPLPWRDFNLYNWNCYLKQEPQWFDFWEDKKSFIKEFIEELEKLDSLWFSDTFKSRYKDKLNRTISKDYSLFKTNKNNRSASMDSWMYATYSREWFKYKKPEDIVNKRIWGFPNFLAWWASRQIEEIANKISTLPWIIVILPDFEWVNKWYENIWEKFEEAKNKLEWEAEFDKASQESEIASIDARIKQIDSILENIDNPSERRNLLEEKKSLVRNKSSISRKIDSDLLEKWVSYWNDIKAWYEVISNLPAIDLQEETVRIRVPYPNSWTIEELKASLELSLAQYEEEIDRFSKEVTAWKFYCEQLEETDEKSKEEKENCFLKLDLASKFILDTRALTKIIERNIDIIESYRDIPKQVWEIIRFRNKYYDQIIQNLETISTVTWWFIKKNWIRFKAWVELFMLIKAVLKSWQLLLDLFEDYDWACWWDCKSNSRFDLFGFLFDMIVPDLPIIIFPKWPDIVIDLHNITYEFDIALPDFEVEFIPIIFPDLPELRLPEFSQLDLAFALSLSGKLPDFELLPEIDLKSISLPDLPMLPAIKLPNLPPPPKLPKLFAWLEALIQLAKLIALMECLLEEIPLVPEWRAWIQISFLTQRNSYLFLDFLIDLSFPDISASFVDAIKVTWKVNLELEADQIADSVRESIKDTINKHSVDIASKLKAEYWAKLADKLDLRKYSPDDIVVDEEIWAFIEDLSDKLIAQTISDIKKLESMSWIQLDSKEFKKYMLESLTSGRFKWDRFISPLVKIWEDENNRKFDSEDRFIQDLYDLNKEKYDTIKSIVESHRQETEDKHIEEFKKLDPQYISIKKISSQKTDLKPYKDKVDIYNSRAYSALERFTNSSDKDTYWLQKQADKTRVALNSVSEKFIVAWQKLSSNASLETNSDSTESNSSNSCYAPKANGQYDYKFSEIKWHYITSPDWNYRLYDYLDEYNWKEELLSSDVDLDGDFDIFHRINNSIYLKTNLKSQPTEKHYSSVLKLDYDDVLEYNYIESLDSIVPYEESWYMNVSFDNNTWKSNFRFIFEQIIDRFSQNPKEENKFDYSINNIVIDWFSNIDENTLISLDDSNAIRRKNLATIKFVWETPQTVSITTREMIKVSDILEKRNIVISPWTRVYSWDDWASAEVSMPGFVWDLLLDKNTSFEYNESYTITWLSSWELYLEGAWENKYTWNDIRNLEWRPILAWTTLKVIGKWEYNINHNIEIEYYDWSENKIFFKDTKYYSLQDLWSDDSINKNIWTDIPNDFYYVKWYAFDSWNIWTFSRQTVSSPQKESDTFEPKISIKDMSIPVYHRKVINLTEYIDENSWIEWIKELYLDTDLSIDLDDENWWDWDSSNDRNVKLLLEDNLGIYSLFKRDWDIMLWVWPFDNLNDRTINLIAIDWNDNIWSSEIFIDIYAPTPYISTWWEEELSWIIDKQLSNQPIDIFRYRWGQISKITDEVETFTNEKWEFDFSVWVDSWVKIEYLWEKIAEIDEKTWIIDFEIWKWYSYKENIRVEDSNITHSYPKIYITNWIQDIYSQYVVSPENSWISIVSNLWENQDEWIYFKLLNQEEYSAFSIPNNAKFNAWDLIINLEDETIFRITKDWKIFANSWNLELKETQIWIVFKLIHNSEIIWEVLIKSTQNYYIK